MPRLFGAYGHPVVHQLVKAFCKKIDTAKNTKKLLEIDRLILCGDAHQPRVGTDSSIILPEKLGVITGRIFDAETHKPVLKIDTHIARKCTENPALLSKVYWGRYVGVLHHTNGSCTLVRDPLGLSTLFYFEVEHGILFANSLALLYDMLDDKPDVNLENLSRYIINIEQASAETPFNGIKELLPGMGLTINPDLSYEEQLLWDISQCKGSYISNTEEADAVLLETLKKTVKAWTQGETGVALELSGGTDSSGIMLLLDEVLDPDLKRVAINFIDSKAPSSNEVEYAKEVTDLCNTPLEFIDMDRGVLDELPTDWRPSRPNTFLLCSNPHLQTNELAQQYNCSAVMNGQGGDHVFLAPQPKRALCDAILDGKLGNLTNTLHELSTVYRTSWTELIKDTCIDLKDHFLGTITSFEKKQLETALKTPYLQSQFIPAKKIEISYLDKYTKQFLPGKSAHIASLAHAVEYSERDNLPGPITTHPLLSQPIVELGLQIPTYQSFANGYDRIFFRRAVTKLKKSKALWRNIKGETSSSMIKNLAKATSQIHELIVNGRLAKEGLINLTWVDQEIQRVKHGQAENLWPLIHIIAVNRWLQQWGLY